MVYIKVFGIERAGALFASKLFSRNFDEAYVKILIDELGDMHNIPPSANRIHRWLKEHKKPTPRLVRDVKDVLRGVVKVYPIVVIKNPYTWYHSIYRHRRKRTIDVEKEYSKYSFLYSTYRDLIDNYSVYDSYYGGVYHRGIVIKYEDLLLDPVKQLTNIRSIVSINYKNRFKRVRHNDRTPFTKREKNFYLSEGPWSLSPTKLRNISNNVDWEVMKCYGYEYVNPKDFYDPCVYEEDNWQWKI